MRVIKYRILFCAVCNKMLSISIACGLHMQQLNPLTYNQTPCNIYIICSVIGGRIRKCNIKDSHAVLFKRYEGNYARGVKTSYLAAKEFVKLITRSLNRRPQKLSRSNHTAMHGCNKQHKMHISKLYKI